MPPLLRHAPSTLRRFLESEAAGGVILMASAALALGLANSPLSTFYENALQAHIGPHSVLHWINDGLMAVFFLLVGLEIKRELLDGHLSHWRARVLPGLGALGGMLAPSLIYAGVNWSSPELLRGWAIPSATDIAFALGVLILLGDRIPYALKVFLTALAILDDLGAIAIIGLFYAGEPAPKPIAASFVIFALLLGLNLFDVKRLFPYLLLGAALWYSVEQSGVHATLAGVLLAAVIPLRTPHLSEPEHTPLHRLENGLGPWVAFLILPLFGLANAGVTLGIGDLSLSSGASVLTGVALGLFLGKQAGVFGAIAFAIKAGLATKPHNVSWSQLYGVSLLCGVGFTMSLFIGQIAFDANPEAMRATKIGVLGGSLLSIAAGSLALSASSGRKGRRTDSDIEENME